MAWTSVTGIDQRGRWRAARARPGGTHTIELRLPTASPAPGSSAGSPSSSPRHRPRPPAPLAPAAQAPGRARGAAQSAPRPGARRARPRRRLARRRRRFERSRRCIAAAATRGSSRRRGARRRPSPTLARLPDLDAVDGSLHGRTRATCTGRAPRPAPRATSARATGDRLRRPSVRIVRRRRRRATRDRRVGSGSLAGRQRARDDERRRRLRGGARPFDPLASSVRRRRRRVRAQPTTSTSALHRPRYAGAPRRRRRGAARAGGEWTSTCHRPLVSPRQVPCRYRGRSPTRSREQQPGLDVGASVAAHASPAHPRRVPAPVAARRAEVAASYHARTRSRPDRTRERRPTVTSGRWAAPDMRRPRRACRVRRGGSTLEPRDGPAHRRSGNLRRRRRPST